MLEQSINSISKIRKQAVNAQYATLPKQDLLIHSISLTNYSIFLIESMYIFNRMTSSLKSKGERNKKKRGSAHCPSTTTR